MLEEQVWAPGGVPSRADADADADGSERYRALCEQIADGVLVATADGVVLANAAVLHWLGAPGSDAVLGRPLLEVLTPDGLRRMDGVTVPVTVSAVVVQWQGQPATQYVLRERLAPDEDPAVSERVHEAVRESEEWFRTLVQYNGDPIVVVDADGNVTYASPSLSWLLDHDLDDVIGRPGLDLVHPDDVAQAAERLAVEIERPEQVTEPLELRLLHRDGSWRHVELVGMNRLHVPAIRGVVINIRDVTDRKRAEAELAWAATHDSLTGLPNRAQLRRSVALALGDGLDRSPVAVLFLDLDRFKVINDRLGHAVGDRVLVEVARRLCAAVGPEDTVGRLGGEEFVVLCPDVDGPEAAMARAARLADAVGRPLIVVGEDCTVTTSVGVALAKPGPERTDPDALIEDADTAMYAAKRRGPSSCVLFDEHLHPALGRASRHLG